MDFSTLETPAVLIDLPVARNNMRRFQDHCNRHGLSLRPHVKTHKIPSLAIEQLVVGAVGINCQKIGEAEVMAERGIDDILISYNILGARKLDRLRALAEKVSNLSVSADSPYVLEGLSRTFGSFGRPLKVLIECDTGAARCGVQSPRQAAELARMVDRLDGLSFEGLMTYPKSGGTARVQDFLVDAKREIERDGLSCAVLSSGGTPDMWRAQEAPVLTEYRVGTYIYNDRSLVTGGACEWRDCALSVLSTVVSSPAPGRAIIDAGSKSLSSDLLGLDGYGAVWNRPDIRIAGLSEEHGHLEYPSDRDQLKVGQQLRVIPNHACVVSNLVDSVVFVDEDGGLGKVPVDARGRVL